MGKETQQLYNIVMCAPKQQFHETLQSCSESILLLQELSSVHFLVIVDIYNTRSDSSGKVHTSQ